MEYHQFKNEETYFQDLRLTNEKLYNATTSPELDSPVDRAKSSSPLHMQLVERSEYMKKVINQDGNDQAAASIGSLTPSSTSSEESGVNWGKHRYSTYYERSHFFKNPFSPNPKKKAQKLSYVNSAISPDATKFVLVSKDKWLLYKINFNEPSLICCGKISGDYGEDFDHLHKEPLINNKIAYRPVDGSISPNDPSACASPPSASGHKKSKVSFKLCALSERLLVLATSTGSIRVHDVLKKGKLVYQYDAGLPIECIDISCKNNLIACGLQGRNKETRGSIVLLLFFEFLHDKLTKGLTDEVYVKLKTLKMQQQQRLHEFAPPSGSGNSASGSTGILRKINSKSSLKNLKKSAQQQQQQDDYEIPSLETLTKELTSKSNINDPLSELKIIKSDSKLITLPYKGIVQKVRFSKRGDRLICSTHKSESKFFVFDVTSIKNLRFIMKSTRTPDDSSYSEGITDFEMFGDNDDLMVIASNARNASPMLINTRIGHRDFADAKKMAQPSRILKLSSIGTNVHRCCANSTNNLFAFLTTEGKIWLAQVEKDFGLKKLEIIDKVSGSSSFKNTSVMKFSPDGTKMYIVDLKGVLFVQDFTSLLKHA